MNDNGTITDWTWEENKLFENALVNYPEECSDRWERIAACLSRKTVADIKEHYEKLLVDIGNIEAGEVALPDYPPLAEDPDVLLALDIDNIDAEDTNEAGNHKKLKKTESRGKAWTEEEHIRFLMGLKVYGQGDWRSIARYCVLTRSATQVASHAQKFATRQKSTNKDRRRSSIHDITTVDGQDIITTLDGQCYNGPNISGNRIINYSDTWSPQDPNSGSCLYGNSGQQPPAGPPPVGTQGTGIEHHMVVSPLNLGPPQYKTYGMQVAAPETADPYFLSTSHR